MHVKDNPCKGEECIKRDKDGKIKRDGTGRRIRVPTKLLMVPPRTLHNYMMENFNGALQNGNIRFSESTLRKLIPNFVKKASARHQIMCGCETCVIFNDMYQCLVLWRKKLVECVEHNISQMEDGHERVKLTSDLEEYKTHIGKDGTAWNVATCLGCTKTEIKDTGEDVGRHFHHFRKKIMSKHRPTLMLP